MGADVYAENSQGQTPLMIANFEGDREIVRILLDGPGSRNRSRSKSRNRSTSKKSPSKSKGGKTRKNQ